MRIIHKASLVFLLSDIYTKSPVTRAVILCNGKQNPYTRTSDGYYVFSNLSPDVYNISIRCSGYFPLEFTVDLKENETKVMHFNMPYSETNPSISNVPRFQITLFENGKPFVNKDIKLKLDVKAPSLELVESVKSGSSEIKLNIEEMTSTVLGQRYIYEVNGYSYEINISGFDSEKKCYTLDAPSKYPLETGGAFYPVWDIRTNSSGIIIMPLILQFMKDPKLSFSCSCGDLLAKVKFNLEKQESQYKLFTVDGNLENSPLPKPPPPPAPEENKEPDKKAEKAKEEVEGEEEAEVDEEEANVDNADAGDEEEANANEANDNVEAEAEVDEEEANADDADAGDKEEANANEANDNVEADEEEVEAEEDNNEAEVDGEEVKAEEEDKK